MAKSDFPETFRRESTSEVTHLRVQMRKPKPLVEKELLQGHSSRWHQPLEESRFSGNSWSHHGPVLATFLNF